MINDVRLSINELLKYMLSFNSRFYSVERSFPNSFRSVFKSCFFTLINSYIITRFVFLPFAFLHLLGASCPAQQVIFNRVSQPEGSFSGIINGISQDPLGYMWFTVHERGLYRSDGYHIVSYQHDPFNPTSLATNEIETVYADLNGIIWVGMGESGLDRLDPNTGIVTHFRHKVNDMGSLSDNRVKTILEDHEGTLWVGTMNGLN